MTAPLDADRPVALVTGGGGDIGRAIAVRLARMSRAVAIVDIDQCAADETAGLVEAAGCKAMAIRADVAIPLLEHCRTERVVALVVDGAGPLRRALTVADDGVAPTPAMVRDVLTAALHHGGAGLAVAANHPGGDPAPTETDRVLAAMVSAGAASVGLRFVGHVVVAGRLWEEVPAPVQRPLPG